MWTQVHEIPEDKIVSAMFATIDMHHSAMKFVIESEEAGLQDPSFGIVTHMNKAVPLVGSRRCRSCVMTCRLFVF